MLAHAARALNFSSFFFFNDTATTEIYTLSLHDALPIFQQTEQGLEARVVEPQAVAHGHQALRPVAPLVHHVLARQAQHRSEEHTSELQSRLHIACRLLLEKKHLTTGVSRRQNTVPSLRS